MHLQLCYRGAPLLVCARSKNLAEATLFRLIVLDPSSLVSGGTGLKPFAAEALDILGKLITEDGSPFDVPVIAVSEQDADALAANLAIARDRFLVPDHDTGDPTAGHGIVQLLKTEYGLQSPREECLAVTGEPDLPLALFRLDVPVIVIGGTGADAAADWRAALLKIAQRTGDMRAQNLDTVLSSLAAAEGIGDPHPELRGSDKAEVTGRSWVALDDKTLGPLSGLHVKMPAALTVDRLESPEPRISKTISPDDLEEAKAYVRSLQAHGQLEAPDAAARSPLLGRPTHYIETDEAGRRLLKRRGFD
jgi:hypothetical protein